VAPRAPGCLLERIGIVLDRPGALADWLLFPDPSQKDSCTPSRQHITQEQASAARQLVEDLNWEVILNVVRMEVIDVVILGDHKVVAPDDATLLPIGPAVNLVSRLEGLCRPLERAVLISGAFAAETTAPLIPLGEHALRGIVAPCAVFTVAD